MEFIGDTLPDRPSKVNARVAELAFTLAENPGQWALYKHYKNASAASVAASHRRRDKRWGRFDWASRDTGLYVRLKDADAVTAEPAKSTGNGAKPAPEPAVADLV